MKNLQTYPGGVFDISNQVENIQIAKICVRYLIWRLKKMGFEPTETIFFDFRHKSMVYVCFSPTLGNSFVHCHSRPYKGVNDITIYLNSKDAAREVVRWAENAISALTVD